MHRNISLIKFFGISGLCLFMSVNAFSQNYPLIDLNELINSPAKYSSEINKNEVEEISTLVYDLTPTIFIGNAGFKIFGEEAPVKAELSAGNFQTLSISNPGFNNVKLLKLKIEDPAVLNASFDLSTLQGFENLEYVLVECTFECSTLGIQNMFSNVEDVMVLYVISTPE